VSDHHSRLLAVPALELLGVLLPDDADPDAHAELVRAEREARWRYKATGEGKIATWWRVPLLDGGATEIHAEIPDTTFLEIRWRRVSATAPGRPSASAAPCLPICKRRAMTH
jgi:muconolactone delta-isomerase